MLSKLIKFTSMTFLAGTSAGQRNCSNMNVNDLHGDSGFQVINTSPDLDLCWTSAAPLRKLNNAKYEALGFASSCAKGGRGEYWIIEGMPPDNYPPAIDLAHLGKQGITITGPDYENWKNGIHDANIRTISSAGRFNQDNFPDVVLGKHSSGQIFIVLGPHDQDIALGNQSSKVITVSGQPSSGKDLSRSGLGWDVTGGVDFNLDGFDDVASCAANLERCYVIFGGKNFEQTEINVNDLGKYGISLLSKDYFYPMALEFTSNFYGSAGPTLTINAEIGIERTTTRICTIKGSQGLAGNINLDQLDPKMGFCIDTPNTHYPYGQTIRSIDVDNDGNNDLILAAPTTGEGSVIVYFGAKEGLPQRKGIITTRKSGTYFGARVAAIPNADGLGNNAIAVLTAGDLDKAFYLLFYTYSPEIIFVQDLLTAGNAMRIETNKLNAWFISNSGDLKTTKQEGFIVGGSIGSIFNGQAYVGFQCLLPSPSVTPSQSISLSASITPSITITPSLSSSVSITASPSTEATPSSTASITPTSSSTATPSATSSISLTASLSSSASVSTTASLSSSSTSSATASNTPTASLSRTVSVSHSRSTTISPSITGSSSLTFFPSPSKTQSPSNTPKPGPLTQDWLIAVLAGSTALVLVAVFIISYAIIKYNRLNRINQMLLINPTSKSRRDIHPYEIGGEDEEPQRNSKWLDCCFRHEDSTAGPLGQPIPRHTLYSDPISFGEPVAINPNSSFATDTDEEQNAKWGCC